MTPSQPAFPRPAAFATEPAVAESTEQDGITVRDHLASLAMQGILAGYRLVLDDGLPVEVSERSIAQAAYRLADAMIAESQRKDGAS